MLLRLSLVVFLTGTVLGGIYWLKLRQQQEAASMAGPPDPPVVAVEAARLEQWQPRLTAAGSVVAIQGIFVTTEVSGQVREISFESGQQTTKGDLLVQLDDSVDQADLRGVIAQRNLAQIKLQRLAKLLKDRSASQSDYDEAKAQLDSAQAAVAAKEALIAKKRITAPFDGRLGIRMVDLGEYLAPGAEIVPLQALDPIYVDYALPERHLPEIVEGREVFVTVAAYLEQEFSGTIRAINPGVEQRTRTVRVRAALDNPRNLLRPGMFAEVSTLLPVRQQVLTVDRTAITFAPYGDTVFLIEEEKGRSLVRRRRVTTGEIQSGRVEIIEGLRPGDRVVIAGQVKLRNDQPVRIDNSFVPRSDSPLTP